jgi:hypothetical protein
MPSLAHEIAVARLDRDPSLLPALAEKLLGKRPRGRHRPVDSTVRFVEPAEIRPDLILGRGRRGPWDAIEVPPNPTVVAAAPLYGRASRRNQGRIAARRTGQTPPEPSRPVTLKKEGPTSSLLRGPPPAPHRPPRDAAPP